MFANKERKLLALALCPGAARGEIEAAAIKLVDSLRSRGVKVEELTQPAALKRSRKRIDPGDVVMTFGQYRGWPIRDIPEPYLAWVSLRVRTQPRLVSIIKKFLKAEDLSDVE